MWTRLNIGWIPRRLGRALGGAAALLLAAPGASARAIAARVARATFPIALAGQAETLEHPKFPYSVFLGPGGFQLDMPQVYWRDLGLAVPAAYRVAMSENGLYGRPIVPVGQLYGGVSAQEVGECSTRLPGARCCGCTRACRPGRSARRIRRSNRSAGTVPR